MVWREIIKWIVTFFFCTLQFWGHQIVVPLTLLVILHIFNCMYTGHYHVHCMIVKTNKTNPQAEFLCAVDHSCMVSSIKWFHATPDNLTITLIKVDDNHDNQDHDHLAPQTAASPGDPHVHLIPSVLPSHSGTYSCVAENVLGQVRHHPLVNSSSSNSWNPKWRTCTGLKHEAKKSIFSARYLLHL